MKKSAKGPNGKRKKLVMGQSNEIVFTAKNYKVPNGLSLRLHTASEEELY